MPRIMASQNKQQLLTYETLEIKCMALICFAVDNQDTDMWVDGKITVMAPETPLKCLTAGVRR